jgi:hypothetical protein
MDIVGHVLLGVAVSGQVSPYTVAVSVLPDIGAIPLQLARRWRNPTSVMLIWYKLWHSPIALFLAWFLPDPAFLIYSTHVIADLLTHKSPYSDLPFSFQWRYNDWKYWFIILILGGIAWVRLFY